MKQEFKKILEKNEIQYIKFCNVCDEVCKEAQKYINWAELRWDYLSSDGLCFGIVGSYTIDSICGYLLDDMSLLSAYTFFELVSEKGEVTPEDFKNSLI